MTLQQLNIFLIVAEEKNFTRAAERLFISQPTVSREIMALEEEIRCTLFVRSRRVLTLTEAGERILPEVRRMVEGAGRLSGLARGEGMSVTGSVRVGYIFHGELESFMKKLGGFFTKNPEIKLETVCNEPREAIESYRRNKVDILIVARASLPEKHGPLFVLQRGRMCVMVMKDSPLFDRESIRLEELRDVPLITTDPQVSAGLFDAANVVCERAGFLPKVIGTGKMLADMKVQMQLRHAVSFAPQGCKGMLGDDVRIIPIEGDRPEFDIMAVMPRKSSCACMEAMSRALQKACADLNRPELGDGI